MDDRFARWSFRAAAIWGLVLAPPLFFLEKRIGADQPPPITHPEYFYGFAGVVFAFQLVFLVISTNPRRYRPLMPPSLVEKLAGWTTALGLYATGRLAGQAASLWAMDFIFFVLFLFSYWKTPAE